MVLKPRGTRNYFHLRFYGTDRGRWLCAPLRYLEEIIFTYPRTEPRENTCLESSGTLGSHLSGRKNGLLGGNSRPRLPGVTSKCKTSSGRTFSCPEALPDHACPAEGPSLPSGPLPARLSYLVRAQFSHWHFIRCDTSLLLPMELLRVQSVPFATRTSS